ncbi:MAG TPA: Mur ligase domain-containing protein [Candidatus Saccharimonadales bacterium]|nr:Mur ligase domain-containing protein [Candidatus Saccharimonadales bacterium]
MHIYFSGIGGTGIGPLALIAHQAGYDVSGSDQQDSTYVKFLKQQGVTDIHVGQTRAHIATVHDKNPIDWFVYTSSLPTDHPELLFCREQGIKVSKRNEFINLILSEKKLKLVAIAGTQGKTTTTAMVIWLFKQLGLPISYAVGTQVSFGGFATYDKKSEYFVYECDEYDRNFLAFEPYFSIISGVSWDHHDVFPTREDYQAAFREFISQSKHTLLWQDDTDYLQLQNGSGVSTLTWNDDPELIRLPGFYNRLDAWLACEAVRQITGVPVEDLVAHINKFPGLERRMERIASGLFSDYAHTPEKIRAAMDTAQEIAAAHAQDVVVVYEPHSNHRQQHIINDYKDCFAGATQVYWLPTYLARYDNQSRIIPPQELISHLSDPNVAVPAEMGEPLKRTIAAHLQKGDMVVAMSAGPLDAWLRKEFRA